MEKFDFVGIPLSIEVICLYLVSSERLYWLREELCAPDCICPKSSVEVPCVGSPVWTS